MSSVRINRQLENFGQKPGPRRIVRRQPSRFQLTPKRREAVIGAVLILFSLLQLSSLNTSDGGGSFLRRWFSPAPLPPIESPPPHVLRDHHQSSDPLLAAPGPLHAQNAQEVLSTTSPNAPALSAEKVSDPQEVPSLHATDTSHAPKVATAQRVEASRLPHSTAPRGASAVVPASHQANTPQAGAQWGPPTTDHCEQHFGMEYIRLWDEKKEDICSPLFGSSTGSAGGSAFPGRLTCRVQVDDHLPKPTAPHTLCDGYGIAVDPSLASKALCPKHRPGYFCDLPQTFHSYQRGAFGACCSAATGRGGQAAGLDLELFPRDHLRDIFGSFEPSCTPRPEDMLFEELPTLFITRERGEHANVFHAMTDYLNAFIALSAAGLLHSPRKVVVLDDHPVVGLDAVLAVAVAGGGLAAAEAPWGFEAQAGRGPILQRLHDLRGPTIFQRALFVPPGYSSIMYGHVVENNSCPHRIELWREFRKFLLGGFGLLPGEEHLQHGLHHPPSTRTSTRQLRTATTAARAAPNITQIPIDFSMDGTLRSAPLPEPPPGEAAAGPGAGQAPEDGRGRGGGQGPTRGLRQAWGFLRGNREQEGEGAGLVNIMYISRRPYQGASGPTGGRRRVGNEEALMAMLQQLPGARAELVDLQPLSLQQQLAAMQRADIVVSMHGAGLTWILTAPDHAGLLELWPKSSGVWQCFEHLAEWSGVLYRRWAPAGFTEKDITNVDVSAIHIILQDMVPQVLERKRASMGK